jgi:hypothetical protein
LRRRKDLLPLPVSRACDHSSERGKETNTQPTAGTACMQVSNHV